MTALESCDTSATGWSSCGEAFRNLSDMDTALEQMLTYNSEEKYGIRCLKGCSIDAMFAFSILLETVANNLENKSGQINSMENTRLIMEQHRNDPLCSTITVNTGIVSSVNSAYADGSFVNSTGSVAPDLKFADRTKAQGAP